MSRSRTRASRALIALLVVCLMIGLVFWLYNAKKPVAGPVSSAAPTPPGVMTVDHPAPVAQSPQVPPPVVTQTPFGAPPAQSPAPSGPTTPTPAAQTMVQAPIAPSSNGAPVQTVVDVTVSDHPLADGKAAIDSGYFLRGRTILNAALVGGKLSASEALQAKQLIAKANDTLIFTPTRHPEDPFVTLYTVASGDSLAKIATKLDVTWELLARMNGITDPRKLRAGQKIKVVRGPFSAVVDKSTFTIDLWLGPPERAGSLFVKSFPVGLGKADSTPDGGWIVRPGGKLKNPKFWGAGNLPPIEADDPKNPLGEYWIALDGTDGNAVGQQSYGIHGTIEPESIGHMASLGCIRLLNDDVALVYEMLADGKSTVIVRN